MPKIESILKIEFFVFSRSQEALKSNEKLEIISQRGYMSIYENLKSMLKRPLSFD